MALVWETKKRGIHYQVRQAGNTIRLYSNSVFHSQWNPRRPLASHLWDLLVLPIFFESSRPQNALLLGVGGGAAINCLHFLSPTTKISGVDIDPTHLSIARRFFKCRGEHVSLICDDAVAFLEQRQKHEKYDLIIEDIFAGSPSDPSDARRAISADTYWLETLAAALSDDGILVMNFEDPTQLKQCLRQTRLNQFGFKSRYRFQIARYENALGVFTKNKTSLSQFKRNLQSVLSESRAQKMCNEIDITRLR